MAASLLMSEAAADASGLRNMMPEHRTSSDQFIRSNTTRARFLLNTTSWCSFGAVNFILFKFETEIVRYTIYWKEVMRQKLPFSWADSLFLRCRCHKLSNDRFLSR